MTGDVGIDASVIDGSCGLHVIKIISTIFKMLNIEYGIICIIFSALGSYCGTYLVNTYVKKTGKQFYIESPFYCDREREISLSYHAPDAAANPLITFGTI